MRGLALLRAGDHRMDVATWLRGLGLEQYAPAFRDNDVDGEVLPELTSDDLIGLGATSIGHRRKLLAAIASLGAAPPAATVMEAPRDAPAPADAERRQLTVMFCDLIGEGSAQEQSVVGETPNLAARLQTLAEPDAVVIAAGTRRLVGDLFEYRDLGAVEVKGIAAPVSAWQVLRPSAVASRFEALRGSALTPVIGRDDEIDLLLRRWARANTGDGQVVLVS